MYVFFDSLNDYLFLMVLQGIDNSNAIFFVCG